MTLAELLTPDLVFPRMDCASKDELLAKLLRQIYDTGRELPLSQQDMLETVYMREQIGGTLLPSGLLIPHARIGGFDDFVFAAATPARPLFHAGQEIHLAAMMITSQSGGVWYLSALAALTRISRDSEFFLRLCGAENPHDFINILKERDQQIS